MVISLYKNRIYTEQLYGIINWNKVTGNMKNIWAYPTFELI